MLLTNIGRQLSDLKSSAGKSSMLPSMAAVVVGVDFRLLPLHV